MVSKAETILSLDPSELFGDEAEYRHLCRLFEQQYGEHIFGPSKKIVPFASKRSARRLSHLNPFRKTAYTEVYQNKIGIKLTLDVQQFRVNELTVKVVDQCVVIDGKHKDRKDYHGFIARSFTRKFFLPKEVDPNTVSAKLSLDGLLVVTAYTKELPAPRVRVIDICRTSKRALTKPPTKATRPPKRPMFMNRRKKVVKADEKVDKTVKTDEKTSGKIDKTEKTEKIVKIQEK